jgi:hypothetical protein
MPTKTLTIPQYAKQVKKKSRIAVFNAVKGKKIHLLPGVISIQKIGRDYLLEVITS